MDLPKSTMGIDIEHDFAPEYIMMPDKKKIIAELKQLGKNVENIFWPPILTVKEKPSRRTSKKF